MGLSELDVKRAIRQLGIAYGKPTEPEQELVGLWRHVLDGVSEEALTEAVSRYCKSPARFFPRAGAIREIALAVDAGRSRRPIEQIADPNEDLAAKPCPVCGARLQLAHDPNDDGMVFDHKTNRRRPRTEHDYQPPKRYRVLHDGWVHRARGEPAVGDVIWPARSAPKQITAGGGER